MMKRFFIKYFAVVLFCLPVFFINIKTSHDWGDDFAQYIHQAKNITTGIPQGQAGYIYNPDFPILGPPSYPCGFPILLSPVYALFGNSIRHFDLYISLFLFLTGILIFRFLITYFSSLISLLLVIVFIYNPWTLNFKMEIMSDIPFAFFLLLCILIYQQRKPMNYVQSIALTFLIGFLISIRNIGLVLVLALAIEQIRYVYNDIRQNKTFNLKGTISGALLPILGFLFYLLLNKFIFRTSGDGIFSYAYIFNPDMVRHFILTNLHYYMAVLRSYFEPWNDDWQFVATLSGTMIFAFIILGMIKKMNEAFDFIDTVVVIYLATIIIYPYSNAGFRFILPLVPYLLYYAVLGIKSINIKLKTHPTILAITMAIFVLLSYQKGWEEISKWQNDTLHGPQEPESIEAFRFISSNTEPTARFEFAKPRALALYTNRSSMSHKPKQTMDAIDRSLAANNIQYILINNFISDDSLKTYVTTHKGELKKTWENSTYSLFKRN